MVVQRPRLLRSSKEVFPNEVPIGGKHERNLNFQIQSTPGLLFPGCSIREKNLPGVKASRFQVARVCESKSIEEKQLVSIL